MKGLNLNLKKNLSPFIPEKSIHQIKTTLNNHNILLNKESILILVCGAQKKDVEKSCRERLLEYCQKNMTKYMFFQAEHVFKPLKDLIKKDLLYLENKFAGYADCIIVILESDGVFAEFGAFAMKKELAKILLVINDIKWKNEKSFINLGPIELVNKYSKFRPTIFTNFKNVLLSIDDVENRLSKEFSRKRRESYDLSTKKNFFEVESKIRMLLLADLINIFSPIIKDEIVGIFKTIYNINYNIDIEIGILKALGIINSYERISKDYDNYYYSTLKERNIFFEYPEIDYLKMRSDVVNNYFKYASLKTNLLTFR